MIRFRVNHYLRIEIPDLKECCVSDTTNYDETCHYYYETDAKQFVAFCKNDKFFVEDGIFEMFEQFEKLDHDMAQIVIDTYFDRYFESIVEDIKTCSNYGEVLTRYFSSLLRYTKKENYLLNIYLRLKPIFKGKFNTDMFCKIMHLSHNDEMLELLIAILSRMKEICTRNCDDLVGLEQIVYNAIVNDNFKMLKIYYDHSLIEMKKLKTYQIQYIFFIAYIFDKYEYIEKILLGHSYVPTLTYKSGLHDIMNSEHDYDLDKLFNGNIEYILDLYQKDLIDLSDDFITVMISQNINRSFSKCITYFSVYFPIHTELAFVQSLGAEFIDFRLLDSYYFDELINKVNTIDTDLLIQLKKIRKTNQKLRKELKN